MTLDEAKRLRVGDRVLYRGDGYADSPVPGVVAEADHTGLSVLWADHLDTMIWFAVADDPALDAISFVPGERPVPAYNPGGEG